MPAPRGRAGVAGGDRAAAVAALLGTVSEGWGSQANPALPAGRAEKGLALALLPLRALLWELRVFSGLWEALHGSGESWDLCMA